MTPRPASLRMPIELRRSPRDTERWFALSSSLSADGLELSHVVADELDDRVWVTFQLPGDDKFFAAKGQLREVRPTDEEAEQGRGAERRRLDLEWEPEDLERVLLYLYTRSGY